jgi:hypothetical protein
MSSGDIPKHWGTTPCCTLRASEAVTLAEAA